MTKKEHTTITELFQDFGLVGKPGHACFGWMEAGDVDVLVTDSKPLA